MTTLTPVLTANWDRADSFTLAGYGGDLGGWTLDDLGCVLAGDLPTGKARVALWVALGVDPSPDAVRSWFSALLAEPA